MAASTPRVTVVTATFDSSATLALTLRSLLAQEETDFECWVVGDHCSDDSEEVVAGFGDERLHWVNLPVNSGSQGVPNNEGISRARGRYVAFLGHDDLWFPWHLSGLLAEIERTGADLCHSLAIRMSQRGPNAALGPMPEGMTYRNHVFPPSSWLLRREAAVAAGGFRDHRTLRVGVDQDFSTRAFGLGQRFSFWPEASVLKFPSRLFGTYGLKLQGEAIPQAAFIDELLHQPRALQHRLLAELAINAAVPRGVETETVGMLLRRIKQRVTSRLVEAYGPDRWPLDRLLVWKVQRRRKRNRWRRGLPPLP